MNSGVYNELLKLRNNCRCKSKDLNTHLSEEDVKMANKQMKNVQHHIVNEIQNKTVMKLPSIITNTLKILQNRLARMRNILTYTTSYMCNML